MTASDLHVESGFARFAPGGPLVLADLVAEVRQAITRCREEGHPRLLLDLRGLAGLDSPNVVDRYFFIQAWAHAAQGRVAVAVVAPEALIDAQRFGVTVAENLGFRAQVFTSETEAVAWLAGQGGLA